MIVSRTLGRHQAWRYRSSESQYRKIISVCVSSLFNSIWYVTDSICRKFRDTPRIDQRYSQSLGWPGRRGRSSLGYCPANKHKSEGRTLHPVCAISRVACCPLTVVHSAKALRVHVLSNIPSCQYSWSSQSTGLIWARVRSFRGIAWTNVCGVFMTISSRSGTSTIQERFETLELNHWSQIDDVPLSSYFPARNSSPIWFCLSSQWWPNQKPRFSSQFSHT